MSFIKISGLVRISHASLAAVQPVLLWAVTFWFSKEDSETIFQNQVKMDSLSYFIGVFLCKEEKKVCCTTQSISCTRQIVEIFVLIF